MDSDLLESSAVHHEVASSFLYLENLYRQPILPPAQVELRRISTLLNILGKPHHSFPTVHVTGTCGKGSTTTMVASVLQSAGYKTGIFRSPHMESYRDRIAIDETVIGESDWLNAFEAVRAVAEDMEHGRVQGYDLGRVSLFELVWAMAAMYFSQSRVEIAVVEVGIGGRLSPTTVLDPEVAIVTNVSLDHTRVLGSTVSDIGREKSYIIKPGCAAVSAVSQPDVIQVVEDRARQTDSPLWLVGRDVTYEVVTHDLQGEFIDVRTPHESYEHLHVGLLGMHQAENAATAIGAIGLLKDRGFSVDEAAIRAGLHAAKLPGRFEIIDGDPPIVLDGARNVASATVLHQTLRDLLPNRPVTLLIGVLEDKDAEGIVDVLAPEAARAVVTAPPWEGRVGDIERVERALRKHVSQVTQIVSIPEALEAALTETEPGGVVLVAGSMYLVASVRELLAARRLEASQRSA